jgi:hypothetical protein
MTDEIKQAIYEFNKENGNIEYNNKDLLKYIIQRLDRLPCVVHGEMIRDSLTTINNFKWFAGILIGINFSLLGGILFLVIS